MKRNGKIAHLPENIREQLNIRLRDGHSGQELVDWLNGLPEVQLVMEQHFGGRPLTHQNISEWRHGGYKEWLDNLEAIPSRKAELELEVRNHLRAMLRNYVEDSLVTLLRDITLGMARHIVQNQTEIRLPQGNSSHN